MVSVAQNTVETPFFCLVLGSWLYVLSQSQTYFFIFVLVGSRVASLTVYLRAKEGEGLFSATECP